MVIATGVTLLVMMAGVINSLEETRRVYYERNRLGDLFCPGQASPQPYCPQIVCPARCLRSRGVASPVRRLLVCPALISPCVHTPFPLPDHGEPRLNAIHLTDGRRMDVRNSDEIILLNSFAKAHDLKPGDTISATMNGAKRNLQIVRSGPVTGISLQRRAGRNGVR